MYVYVYLYLHLILYLYYVDPPAVVSCQPNFGSEIKALCKSAKNTPESHQTSYKSYLSEIGSAHKKFSPFELITLGGQSLLWTEHKSSCNPKVVWGEEQCWPTCRNSLSLFPDFSPRGGQPTYVHIFWPLQQGRLERGL